MIGGKDQEKCEIIALAIVQAFQGPALRLRVMKVFAVRREKLAATGSQLFSAAFQFLGQLWPGAMGFGTIQPAPH